MDNPENHTIAAENITSVAAQEFDNPDQKVDAIVYCVAFCVGQLFESELRAFLTAGGMDLTDYSQFEVAQDVTSLYVAAGALEITDLFTGSLVACDTPLVRKMQIDGDLRDRLEQVRCEGIIFRDFIMTGEML